MYTASMDAPMRYEYAQIYMWAAAQANAFHHKKPVEEFWAKLDGHVVHDEDILIPSVRFHHEYRDLCREVRQKVVAHQLKRERANQKKNNNSPEMDTPDLEDYGVQLDLF
jgi:hypothetical protein